MHVPRGNREFQKAIELSGPSGAFKSNLAYAYATSGHQADALSIAETLTAKREKDPNGRRRHRGDLCRAWVTMTKP